MNYFCISNRPKCNRSNCVDFVDCQRECFFLALIAIHGRAVAHVYISCFCKTVNLHVISPTRSPVRRSLALTSYFINIERAVQISKREWQTAFLCHNFQRTGWQIGGCACTPNLLEPPKPIWVRNIDGSNATANRLGNTSQGKVLRILTAVFHRVRGGRPAELNKQSFISLSKNFVC